MPGMMQSIHGANHWFPIRLTDPFASVPGARRRGVGVLDSRLGSPTQSIKLKRKRHSKHPLRVVESQIS